MNKFVKELKRKREGVVMINHKSNIKINCTEKFVKHWEKLGFNVVEYKMIKLVS